jgi:hypothetical protein
LANGRIVIGSSDYGILVSSEKGDSWEAVNNVTTGRALHALAVDSAGYIFAGTDSGVFRISVPGVTGINRRNIGIPVGYALEQNYPNPFNPVTTISYQLPTQSHVTLKIFDVLGREVATLVNGVEEPGYKSVNFNANWLASGVYFCRLIAGSYIDTKKLLLLR